LFKQAGFLFSPEVIASGERRGIVEHFGPWQMISGYEALATSCDFDEKDDERALTIYGMRKMSHPVQSGHALEGQVSVMGHKYRAFTSSQMFELPDGKLVNVAIIHVCQSPLLDLTALDQPAAAASA
jgi:hypothetical protein